jgi:SAM-dependent methyltransferase
MSGEKRVEGMIHAERDETSADPARLSHPSTARNKDAILEVLADVLPEHGTILEIASGTGEHAAHLASRLAPGRWLPSDPDPRHRASVDAWRRAVGEGILLPALAIDAAAARWPVEDVPPAEPITAILAINLIHIAPWAVTVGLMAAAGRILPEGGILYLYGAYKRGGVHTAQSNIAFDRWLKDIDPAFGVRDMERVEEEARRNGLSFLDRIAMPANNFSLIFKAGAEDPE